MGTPGILVVRYKAGHAKDEEIETCLCIEKQCDGYPDGLGADIKQALGVITGTIQLTNGCDTLASLSYPGVFNGPGCFAAYLALRILFDQKTGIGHIYLSPPRDITKLRSWEWGYEFYFENAYNGHYPEKPILPVFRVYDGEKVVYEGKFEDCDFDSFGDEDDDE